MEPVDTLLTYCEDCDVHLSCDHGLLPCLIWIVRQTICENDEYIGDAWPVTGKVEHLLPCNPRTSKNWLSEIQTLNMTLQL